MQMTYSWFASDVTAAMLVYRTMVKEVFWEFGSIIMQNLSDILPLFCTPTCPPHHVSATQELHLYKRRKCKFALLTSTLFFSSHAIRKRPIGEATPGLHVGQIETVIAIHVKRMTKKGNSGSYLKAHLDKF